jgi:hypothetical protein
VQARLKPTAGRRGVAHAGPKSVEEMWTVPLCFFNKRSKTGYLKHVQILFFSVFLVAHQLKTAQLYNWIRIWPHLLCQESGKCFNMSGPFRLLWTPNYHVWQHESVFPSDLSISLVMDHTQGQKVWKWIHVSHKEISSMFLSFISQVLN